MPARPLPRPPLQWLQADEPFAALHHAWGPHTAAPGLLAASEHITAWRLEQAYRQGIFPWYSTGQPVLWWSPDPRMVLRPEAFVQRRSLRQSLQRWALQPGATLAFDRDFEQVVRRCAQHPRRGQSGTWIGPAIVQAYTDLHRKGLAHSAELWAGPELVAGLYFVAIGQAVFGESMFTSVSDGSKMALSLLVHVAQANGVILIDCQQNTAHLASLGANEVGREAFVQHLQAAQHRPSIDWVGAATDGPTAWAWAMGAGTKKAA